MKEADLDLVRKRLSRQERFRPIRDKIHALRRLVADDRGPAASGARDQFFDAGEEDGYSPWRKVLATNFRSGKGNEMGKMLRTLVMQTAFQMPEFEFDKIPDPLSSQFHKLYMAARWGDGATGCRAVPHLRAAMMDRLVGGFSAIVLEVVGDRVGLRWADSIETCWDLTAPMLDEARWFAYLRRAPFSEWKRTYESKAWREIEAEPDEMVSCWIYYDAEGRLGRWAVWPCNNLSWTPKTEIPAVLEPNPFTRAVGDRVEPYMPVEFTWGYHTPSTIVPQGVAEFMLPSQIELWLIEQADHDTLTRGAPFYEVEESALSPEDMERFARGEIAAIIQRNPGSGGIVQHKALEVSATQHSLRLYHMRQIQQLSGANAFASGGQTDVGTATEARQVMDLGNLTAQYTATEHARFIERLAEKYLYAAAKFDDDYLQIDLEGARMSFGPGDPVRLVIETGKRPVVKEDRMRYEAADNKIARASALLQQAVGLASVFPQMLPNAAEELLRAYGHYDVQTWLAPPAAPDASGTPGLDAGFYPGDASAPGATDGQGSTPPLPSEG